MDQGVLRIYYGEGRGKSTAALGDAIRAASEGKDVVMVQFLKGVATEREIEMLDRLEPEIRRFRFSKSDACYDELTEEQRKEENVNLLNGYHYAKKVVSTGESTFVVFDEILGLVDRGLIDVEDLKTMVVTKPEETTIIFTGRVLKDEIRDLADEIYCINTEK